MLQNINYTIFGLGNSLYAEHFNTVAKNCDKFFYQLSARRYHSLGLGDENVSQSKNGCIEKDFEVWRKSFLKRIGKQNNEELVEDQDAIATLSSDDDGFSHSDDDSGDSSEAGDGLVDLEDMGRVMKKVKEQKKAEKNGLIERKEMITPTLRKSLTKQGYRLIGSHSGVKVLSTILSVKYNVSTQSFCSYRSAVGQSPCFEVVVGVTSTPSTGSNRIDAWKRLQGT